METQQAATWRELLGQLIENTRERRRLAEAAHVNAATLQRWARDRTLPREEHMEQLLAALPSQIYPVFLRLAAVDFPGLLSEKGTAEQNERLHPEVPPEFYGRVLDAFASTPWPLCRQAVQDLILQQMIELLDSERHGLAISIIRCMPPRCDGQVHSLREIGGIGTHPWKHDLEQKAFFFGAESLVGHAVSTLTGCVVNSRLELTFYPAHWTAYENSAAAFPVMRHAGVAGGLVASSSRENFFSHNSIAILEQYACLAALLFDVEDFYSSETINLRVMPPYNYQEPFFRHFNQRVSQKFAEELRAGHQIGLQEARLAVWQDLEAELLAAVLPPAEAE